MAQNAVTLTGIMITAAEVSMDDHGKLARFRLLLQARRMDRVSNSWTTSDRTYLQVACRRQLATNVAACLRQGDPVIVTGVLRTRRRSSRSARLELEANAVGLDLSRIAGPIARSTADGAA